MGRTQLLLICSQLPMRNGEVGHIFTPISDPLPSIHSVICIIAAVFNSRSRMEADQGQMSRAL